MTSAEFKRQLREVAEIAGNHVRLGDRWLLNLASNNYLGLSNDRRVQRAAVEAIQKWGTGTGSSPLLSGFTSLHQELAQTISDWKTGALTGAELAGQGAVDKLVSGPVAIRTLLFPCGYSANLAALNALLEPNAQVFADRKNHASLVDGLRMAKTDRVEMTVRYYRHRDFSNLARLLEQSDARRPRWIVTDSVFSMDGTCTRPSDLEELVTRFEARLLIDEAHATGVMGSHGAGFFSFETAKNEPGLWRDGRPQFAVVGTLSKALASVGGFFAGPADLVDRMIQTARPLIYSTSLPASSVAAAMSAINLSIAEPWRRAAVQQNTATLHTELTKQGWKTTGDPTAPLLAVVVGDHQAAQRLADELMESGIWAPAIRPPTV
ncbi:MAG: aminotransferase class I/II-fold pyridoxal phosphate-dependent enzyme, partial [Pirellulaceae bacterium]|nr:aminotransferase class I/II-fold pyridoxal phosphate-dependent enzyme [Pirellulaceae bacterium]